MQGKKQLRLSKKKLGGFRDHLKVLRKFEVS